jgi:YD repeat-containing protein
VIKENQIKSKTTTHYSKGFNNSYKEYFDEEGYMTKKEYINSKSGTVTNITYNGDHKITSIVTQNNKSEKWTTTMNYENDLMVETENIDEKGNYSGTKKEYNEEGLLLRHLLFKKSRTEPTHELIYTYYEGGSKKNIIYKEKGKYKYEWNFDCKEEGELVNVKTKDQSTICIKEEVDKDGNTIIWNREFSEDGTLIKTKEVRSVENVLISRETFNQEDRLLSKSIMKESGGFLREGYNKKGEVSSRRETFTNNSGKLIKSEYTSKGLNYTYIYSYEGDLWSTNSRISKRRITVDQYQYEYY